MVNNKQTYHQLLVSYEEIKNEHTNLLKEITQTFPYFQSARALYLKALKNNDSFRYNHELKITAAYTSDRTVLFDFITSNKFKEKPLGEKNETPSDTTVKENKSLNLGKPIQFSISEKHSFHQWLQLSTQKQIRPIAAEEKEQKTQLIDRFIQSNSKIIPLEKGKEVEISIPENKVNKALMTETLAKVYLEQKKYSKAIKAYEILSLKYPEKSGFFADQIKKIKLLKQKKS